MTIIPQQLQQRRPQLAQTVAQQRAKTQPGISQPIQPTQEQIQAKEEAEKKKEAQSQLQAIEQRIEKYQELVKKYDERYRTAKTESGAFSADQSRERYKQYVSGLQQAKSYATGEYTLNSVMGYGMDIATSTFERTQPQKITRAVSKVTPTQVQKGSDLDVETQRYQQFGYSKSEAKILAQESLAQGGMSFAPETARGIIQKGVKETTAIAGYDMFGRPQYVSIAPEKLTPTQKVRKEMGLAIEPTTTPKVTPEPKAITPWEGVPKGFKDITATTKGKLLVNEFLENPTTFVQKHGKQAGTKIMRGLGYTSELTETYLTSQQEVPTAIGEQEMFGGRTDLLPFESKGTGVVTDIKFYSDEELLKKYPLGAMEEIIQRQKSLLDVESQSVVSKYINEFKDDFENKVQEEIDLVTNDLQNKMNRGEINPKKAQEEYDKKVNVIIKSNENQFKQKVTDASKGELDVLNKKAENYIKTTSKDIAVRKAIALAPVDFLTGTALTFGLGSIGAAGKFGAGIIGFATLTQTPEIVGGFITNPLVSGISAGSFLLGGGLGAEGLRVVKGRPTITGRVTKSTAEVLKRTKSNIDAMIDDVAAGRQKLYSFSESAQILQTVTRKKKKLGERTALDELTDHLEDLKDVGDQKSINEALGKIAKKMKEKIDALPKDEQARVEADFKRWVRVLQDRGIISVVDVVEIVPTERFRPDIPIRGEVFGREKVTPTTKPGEISLVSLITPSLSKATIKSKVKEKLAERQASFLLTGMKTKQMIKEKAIQRPSVSSASSLLTGMKTAQISKTKQQQIPTFGFGFPTTRNRFEPRKSEPKIKKIVPIVPALFFPEEEKQRKEQAYYGQVKRKGKWTTITPKPATKRAAVDYASEVADKTLAASFRVIKVKKKIKGKEKFVEIERKKLAKATGYWDTHKYKFRTYKIRKGTKQKLPRGGIEKKQFRLDLPGEKKTIQKARGVRGFFGF
ncbi:MAG TPA: hypothetical protein ENG87_03935 [Candidatus Pacearchaeota archaeon]|nr:hypothetical protein [Candidatus Pacearchaeota archaeon]HDZ61182.1 hypothetical protein [Candidatus Pacearchaeota archaeon]